MTNTNYNLQKKSTPLKVVVLGSTGSVGRQAMEVISEIGANVIMLAAGENIDALASQINFYKPEIAYVSTLESAVKLKEIVNNKTEIIYGDDALESAILSVDADVIIHSIAGLAGIKSAVAAAKRGCRLAMANKEAIIAAGDLIFNYLKSSGGHMIPVDSEHSAIFQCLETNHYTDNNEALKRILLTASGGPFYGYSKEQLSYVTPEQALEHPTWSMGSKITIDSATLMNKGFEIIEAVRLFNIPEDKVEVLIHRQSIIHSMIEYIDNTVIAQLAAPDMRSCIRYALTYPERIKSSYGQLDFTQIGALTFDIPNYDSFPLLNMARYAIRQGGSAPAELIAADEVAVDAFLNYKISFRDISSLVIKTMDMLEHCKINTEEDIRLAVNEAKRKALYNLSSI